MANPSSTPTKAPPPHDGVHYPNPSSKPVDSPVGKAEQEGTQRLVWKVFFLLIACVVVLGVVLGLLRP